MKKQYESPIVQTRELARCIICTSGDEEVVKDYNYDWFFGDLGAGGN